MKYIALFSIFLFSCTATKQLQPVSTTIQVEVYQQWTKNAISGATVMFHGKEESIICGSHDGSFETYLLPGTYTVFASAVGFNPATIKNYVVGRKKTILNIPLTVSVFECY